VPTRREFIGSMSWPAAALAAGAALSPAWSRRARAAEPVDDAHGMRQPPPDRRGENFWFQVSQAFTVDRSIINLNNGGVSPSPAIVQDSMKRHLDYSNTAPPYAMWKVLEPQREAVRGQLARLFGADPEEIAITRNASEGLQTCQFGLDLKPGDEVLTTTQDYPRMLTTFRQRARREGIVLRQFALPIPCEDADRIVALFQQHITPRTRLILASHIINITGQVLPVKAIAAMARARGIPVIIDGAHALAHLDFSLDQLECDYYATSLHKWLFAPHGTGLLYVRREKITSLWPLLAAEAKLDDDIRKFEEIGTHPAANALAIAEAVTFHRGIGAARKHDRLIQLRDHWADRLLTHERVRLHSARKPGFGSGLATFEVDGIDPIALNDWLWEKHRILTTAIKHDEFQGIRVTPSVYTTFDELDRFVEAVEHVIRHGLPGA
jgi:isopenicillin-N epimerase